MQKFKPKCRAKKISLRGGVYHFFCLVNCDPVVHRLWPGGAQILEIILVLLPAGMYSMCYSLSAREVELVLNISRSLQDYILWRQENHRPAARVGLRSVCLTSLWMVYLFVHALIRELLLLFPLHVQTVFLSWWSKFQKSYVFSQTVSINPKIKRQREWKEKRGKRILNQAQWCTELNANVCMLTLSQWC